jgi:hypothetical protein
VVDAGGAGQHMRRARRLRWRRESHLASGGAGAVGRRHRHDRCGERGAPDGARRVTGRMGMVAAGSPRARWAGATREAGRNVAPACAPTS